MNINGKEFKVTLNIISYYREFRFSIFSNYGNIISNYEIIGDYYISKDYTTMTFNVTFDTLFRKYEGQEFIFE